MLRLALFLAVLSLALPAGEARADGLQDDFKQRIEVALNETDSEKKLAAVEALFYTDGLDQEMIRLTGRAAKRLAKTRRRTITFEPLPADTDLVHVVDGYEYRPNLAPLGYAVFSDPAEAPGNATRALYGPHPENGRYYISATVRRLVNPDAAPDKQLQMIAIGVGHPAVTFEGWCDVALSNQTVKRITLEDQGVGNQTRILRGQAIRACELTNTAGRGTLSLRLLENDDLIFERRVEAPANTIIYAR
jgi:hypothetical protein